MTEPDSPAVDLATAFGAGVTAPATVYALHGEYTDVEDLDGSMVEIERPYPADKVALEIPDRVRGNVLVAEGEVVSEAVAAKIAAAVAAG